MSVKDWEKRNEEHVGDIARDDDLGDMEYCEVLEHLVEQAQSALDAKREEMDTEE